MPGSGIVSFVMFCVVHRALRTSILQVFEDSSIPGRYILHIPLLSVSVKVIKLMLSLIINDS